MDKGEEGCPGPTRGASVSKNLSHNVINAISGLNTLVSALTVSC